jgi:hypothetical protein
VQVLAVVREDSKANGSLLPDAKIHQPYDATMGSPLEHGQPKFLNLPSVADEKSTNFGRIMVRLLKAASHIAGALDATFTYES